MLSTWICRQGERLWGRQRESCGQQSLRATSRVLLRKAEKKPDVLWNEGIWDVGHQAKFSSFWFQPNHRQDTKVSVEILGRKPGLRNLLKTRLASAQGTAQGPKRWTSSVSHDDRKGQAGHSPEGSRLTHSFYVVMSSVFEAEATVCPQIAILQIKNHDFGQPRLQWDEHKASIKKRGGGPIWLGKWSGHSRM